MLARGRLVAVLVAAVLAAAFVLPLAASPAAAQDWCGAVTLRIWPTTGARDSSLPLYLRIASAYPQEIVFGSVRGQFAGSSTVYAWGSVIIGAYAGANLSQTVRVPASGGDSIAFTLVGRALGDAATLSCTLSVGFIAFNPGIPSTGFEGASLMPAVAGFVVALVLVVGIALVWARATRPPPPVGRPSPPLTRCPVCGAPLVPGSPAGFWLCERCGWQ